MKRILFLTIVTLSFLWSTAVLAKIYSYTKITDEYTTYTVVEPDYKKGDDRVTELCTIDDLTYISVPDGVTLPEQFEQVQKTLKEVVPSKELKDKIRQVSVHYRLINERIKDILPKMKPEEGRYFMLSFSPTKMEVEKAKYGISDTVKNLKESLTPYMKESVGYEQEIEQLGVEQKAKLGLN
jgi:hypothetical protein